MEKTEKADNAAKAAELAVYAFLGLKDKDPSGILMAETRAAYGKAIAWCDRQLTDTPHLNPLPQGARKSNENPSANSGRTETKTAAGKNEPKAAKTLGELFTWAIKHGKEFTPEWVCDTAGLDRASLQARPDADAIFTAQNEIRAKMDWED